MSFDPEGWLLHPMVNRKAEGPVVVVDRAGETDIVRVLIADDHVPTRTNLRMILEEEGFRVCAEAASAELAVGAAVRERPDLCLLDVNMPGSGIAAAEVIAKRVPETVVVMLTVSRSQQDVTDSLEAGARGYLLKDMDPGLMSNALRAVLGGEKVVPRLSDA